MGESVKILQDASEIAALADLVKAEGVASYLEIGSKFGGSLKAVSEALPTGSRIVSVDLPADGKVAASRTSLLAVLADLQASGYDARGIWGDSTAPEIVAQVGALGPFDLVLIDANHTLPFVTRDWINYGSMGRMVAFHDISWRRAPEWQGERIDVPEFWRAISPAYRHVEFRMCPTGKNNGIGVLWRS